MGGAGPVPHDGFLVGGLVLLFWWTELDFVSLNGSSVLSSDVFWSAYALV